MNTLQPPALNHKPTFTVSVAMISWALVVAFALLSYFVHVLNEQVQRSESWREQFRLSAVTPANKSRPLRLADAGAVRQVATTAATAGLPR